MYTAGPRRAELPRNEYRQHMIKIIVFFHSGHWTTQSLFDERRKLRDIPGEDHSDHRLGQEKVPVRTLYHLPLPQMSEHELDMMNRNHTNSFQIDRPRNIFFTGMAANSRQQFATSASSSHIPMHQMPNLMLLNLQIRHDRYRFLSTINLTRSKNK